MNLIAARHRNGSQVFVTGHTTIQVVWDASLGSSRGPNLILRPCLKSPGFYCNSKVVSDFSFDIGKVTSKTGGILIDPPVRTIYRNRTDRRRRKGQAILGGRLRYPPFWNLRNFWPFPCFKPKMIYKTQKEQNLPWRTWKSLIRSIWRSY